jgi:hypothetical protein
MLALKGLREPESFNFTPITQTPLFEKEKENYRASLIDTMGMMNGR